MYYDVLFVLELNWRNHNPLNYILLSYRCRCISVTVKTSCRTGAAVLFMRLGINLMLWYNSVATGRAYSLYFVELTARAVVELVGVRLMHTLEQKDLLAPFAFIFISNHRKF